MEYLLRLTKLPTTDMLFNKWKESTGTKQQQKKERKQSSKRDGETSQLSSVQGVPAAHPKLIRLALLWSAGRWGNKEGEWKSDGR